MRFPIMIVMILLSPIVAFSATLEVPGTYPTIQDAISAANVGDMVLVAPGTYVENLDYLGKAITVKSSGGADVTVIDGNQSGSVLHFHNGEGLDSVLDGFSITNGSGTKTYYQYYAGGGIYCYDHCSPMIINNVFYANPAETGGAIFCQEYSSPEILNNEIYNHPNDACGIYCYSYSSPHIAYNSIHDNAGGGIYADSKCDPLIEKNEIFDNDYIATNSGSGITGYNSGAVIDGNIIYGNHSASGGAIMAANSYMTISNNLIHGNTADYYGGGIYSYSYYAGRNWIINNMIYGNSALSGGGICLGDRYTTVINTTITNNTATNSYKPGGGIHCKDSCDSILVNSIVYDNIDPYNEEVSIHSGTLNVTYSDIKGGWSGTGNIDANPVFVGASHDDFHICYTSPCKDAGDGAASGLPGTDFEGDSRTLGVAPDMGADEFRACFYYTGDATPGGTAYVTILDLPYNGPMMLYVGSGVLGLPIVTPYGDWYLDLPVVFQAGLGYLSPDGAFCLPYTFAPDFPAPWDIPIQVLIGSKLTELCVMEVR